MRLEIIITPTKRIPAATVRAVKIAKRELYRPVCSPAVEEKVSSKVTANMRLYKSVYRLMTTMPKAMLMYISVRLIARMLPNIKAVTSVFKPDVSEVTRMPRARALDDKRATAASPFISDEEPIRNSKKAEATTTGIETARGEKFRAMAMARVPKPTWDNPSPIIEKRFKTRLTPRRAAHRAIQPPPTRARIIKVYENKSFKRSIIGSRSPRRTWCGINRLYGMNPNFRKRGDVCAYAKYETRFRRRGAHREKP